MTRARARGKASVLARQKPRRDLGRGPRRLVKNLFAHGPKLLGVGLGFGLVYAATLATQKLAPKLTAWWQEPALAHSWTVDILMDGEEALADRRVEELIRTARESLGRGDLKDLQRTVERLRAVDAFGMVRLVRVGFDRVVVQVQPRKPVMCAEADRLRLVADSGEIYGVAGVEGVAPCKGPLLRGIPSQTRRPNLSRDLTLDLADDDQKAVQDALALHAAALAHDFELTTIVFNPYRGFSATIANSATDITLGRAPFADKFAKLRSILTGLARKGEVASRIELDYHGKAFVKLRNL